VPIKGISDARDRSRICPTTLRATKFRTVGLGHRAMVRNRGATCGGTLPRQWVASRMMGRTARRGTDDRG
jgi:hypothetical protein